MKRENFLAAGLGLLWSMPVLVSAVGLPRPASAALISATLDLSSLAIGPFTTPQTVLGGDFVLTPTLGASSIPQIGYDNGVYSLQSTNSVFSGGADTNLTRADGGTFSLLSVDVAALLGDNSAWGIAIGNYDTDFILVGANYGSPLSQSWMTLDLTSFYFLQNVTSVTLDPVSIGPNFSIAAIVVAYDPIPEPATAGLLGAGLFGLGLMRRRRR